MKLESSHTLQNGTRRGTVEWWGDALSQFETDVARRAMGGGAEPLGAPGDQGYVLSLPTPSVSVKNHGGEADATLVTSVGCVVERPFEGFVV